MSTWLASWLASWLGVGVPLGALQLPMPPCLLVIRAIIECDALNLSTIVVWAWGLLLLLWLHWHAGEAALLHQLMQLLLIEVLQGLPGHLLSLPTSLPLVHDQLWHRTWDELH